VSCFQAWVTEKDAVVARLYRICDVMRRQEQCEHGANKDSPTQPRRDIDGATRKTCKEAREAGNVRPHKDTSEATSSPHKGSLVSSDASIATTATAYCDQEDSDAGPARRGLCITAAEEANKFQKRKQAFREIARAMARPGSSDSEDENLACSWRPGTTMSSEDLTKEKILRGKSAEKNSRTWRDEQEELLGLFISGRADGSIRDASPLRGADKPHCEEAEQPV
jgi:hypothetical protein